MGEISYNRKTSWAPSLRTVLAFSLIGMAVGFLTFGESHPEEAGPSHKTREGHQDSVEHMKAVEPDQKGADRRVHLRPEVVVRSGIRTEPVEYRRLVREIQTVGEITYDERRVKVVSAWIGGRIDALHVDFTGIGVRKGEPLAQIYSPDLVSTQEEYLLALKSRREIASFGNKGALKSADHLVTASRERLLLLGYHRETNRSSGRDGEGQHTHDDPRSHWRGGDPETGPGGSVRKDR
jgi:hypothetical protein